MIVPETLLKTIFSQIPDVIDEDSLPYTVKFEWGSPDDLNLYLADEPGNRFPLIWMVQDKSKGKKTEVRRRTKLVIAKKTENPTARNPTVWAREFETVLDPLLDKVIKCLEQSGVTTIVRDEYDVYREANYSGANNSAGGRDERTAATTEIINVITLEAEILFTGVTQCINEINFN